MKVRGDLDVRGTILQKGVPVDGTSTFYLTVAHSDDTQSFGGISVIKVAVADFYLTQNSPNTDEVLINAIAVPSAATTPGGSDNQIQYNDGGTFAGATDFEFDEAGTADRVLIPFGDQANPGISFALDNDTGIYRKSSNIIGFVAGTSNSVDITSTGIRLVQRGTAASPAIFWSNDTNTGLFLGITDNSFNVAQNGSLAFSVFQNKVVTSAGFYTGFGEPIVNLTEGSNITITRDVGGSPSFTIAASGGGTITFAESESGGFSQASDTLKFDSTTFYLTEGGDGNPLVSSQDQVYQIPIFGAFTTPDSTGSVFFQNYTTVDSGAVIDPLVLTFSNVAAKRGIRGTFTVPQNFVGASSLVLVWTADSGTSDSIVWDLSYLARSGTEDMGAAATATTDTVTTAHAGTAFSRNSSQIEIDSTNLAAGDQVLFELFRDGANVADTLAADGLVFQVLFQYSGSS